MRKKESCKVATDTASLKTGFQTDYKNFTSDSTAAKLAYTSKHRDLTVLQTNLDVARAKVHALGIALISVAAAEGALLTAMAVVAVVTEGAACNIIYG